jgi:putative DNA primase/helicase
MPAEDGGTKYVLEECPFDPGHRGKDAAIFQGPNGELGAKCFHNSCSGNHWREFKAKIGKPDREHWDPPLDPRRGRKRKAGKQRQVSPGLNGADVSAEGNGHVGDGNPQDKGPRLPLEAEGDPHRLARVFLWGHLKDLFREQPDVPPEQITLRYWCEEWYEWDGYAYRKLPGKEIRARVTAAVKAEFDRLNLEDCRIFEDREDKKENEEPPEALQVTTKLVGDVLQALSGMTLLPTSVVPPAWISGRGPFPAGEVLAAGNALVHLPNLVEGRPDYSCSPTLDFFSTNAFEYDFNPEAPAPAEWLRFLGELWPDDPDAIGTLQEWFGYSLLPDTAQQKILMIVGPRRSGKGTIARVLRALVGVGNTVAPTLAGLGTNFGLWPLLGKTVAIISDARLSGRTDIALVTERLLSISGEDALTIDRKNLSHVTCQLPVRFVILTNELPRLSDPSGALVGRLILLRQTKTWYGQEDTGLTRKLLGELPGILLWSIAGWQRLRARGRFVQPPSACRLLRDMEDLSSPIGAFIRECCIVGPGREILVRDLFERWKQWCEEKSMKDAGHQSTFGRDLRAAVPHLEARQPRVGGERVRTYVGIRLRMSNEEAPE